jgi:hypothetical protein
LSGLNIAMDTDDASEIEQTAKRIRDAFVAFDAQLQDQGKRTLKRFEMDKFRESNESLFGY